MTFISLLENCLLLVSIHISVSFSITHNSLSLSLYSRSLALSLHTHACRCSAHMQNLCKRGVGAADSARQRKTISVLLSTLPNVGFRVLEKDSKCFM